MVQQGWKDLLKPTELANKTAAQNEHGIRESRLSQRPQALTPLSQQLKIYVPPGQCPECVLKANWSAWTKTHEGQKSAPKGWLRQSRMLPQWTKENVVAG